MPYEVDLQKYIKITIRLRKLVIDLIFTKVKLIIEILLHKINIPMILIPVIFANKDIIIDT